MVFQVSGIANGNTGEQLKNFYYTLRRYDSSVSEMPKDWIGAFELLIRYLSSLSMKRKVVFLDELPWVDTPGANFVSALEHFWNGWASARRDIVLIVCGSATSWMMDKLINNHGGLYGRLTRRMMLQPFSLDEEERAAQIDMVIERADNTINICEMKFSEDEFAISKDYDKVLRNKIVRFQEETKSRKSVQLTLVTSYGIKKGMYAGIVQNEVVLDDLFE